MSESFTVMSGYRITPQEQTPPAECKWEGCSEPQCSPEVELCGVHAWRTSMRFHALLEADSHSTTVTMLPECPLVYYLLIRPTVVKIGMTKSLVQRVTTGLRSEMQYLVAVEPGGFDVEHQRHRQFAADRIGRREDFRVSPELEAHVAHLRSQTYSDELIAMRVDIDQRPKSRR